MGFGKKYIDKGNKYIDNPDTFGIRELPPLVQEVIRVHDEVQQTTQTNREAISALIRKLTYRELKQIGEELYKNTIDAANRDNPGDATPIDFAQTLDDWAHMVKDEDDPYKGHTMAGEPFVDK